MQDDRSMMVGLLVVVVCVHERLDYAVVDGAVFMRIPVVYGVSALVARDCDINYKHTPLLIVIGFLNDQLQGDISLLRHVYPRQWIVKIKNTYILNIF